MVCCGCSSGVNAAFVLQILLPSVWWEGAEGPEFDANAMKQSVENLSLAVAKLEDRHYELMQELLQVLWRFMHVRKAWRASLQHVHALYTSFYK